MPNANRPGKGNRIFISAVSGEFEHASAPFAGLRSRLRHYLTRADCEVKVQEDFRQTSGSTLEKLDAYIRDSDAVIHLVGKLPGHLADADSPHDVPDYLGFIAREPGERRFLDQQPDLLAEFGDGSGLSLTQFEAYMALHHAVPLFVYATADAIAGQQAHLNRLLTARPRRHASPFRDAEDLLGQLMGDLRHIIPLPHITEQSIGPNLFVSCSSAADFLGLEEEQAPSGDATVGRHPQQGLIDLTSLQRQLRCSGSLQALRNVAQTVGAKNHWLHRPELAELISRIQCSSHSTTLVLGEPGSGKSALLARLEKDIGKRFVILVIKADDLPAAIRTSVDLAPELGLPRGPDVATSVRRLAEGADVLLLMDQLDALSEFMVEQPARLRPLLQLVRELAGECRVHIVASCRSFEYQHDPSLRSIKADKLLTRQSNRLFMPHSEHTDG